VRGSPDRLVDTYTGCIQVFNIAPDPHGLAVDESLRHLQRSIGRRVSEIRLKADLTQRALGEKCGVDLKYVQDIEGGRQNLTLRTLLKVAAALDVDVSELFSPPASLQAKRGPGRPKSRKAPTED
jgi:DNA-binding XRE family transcriptional regulator